MASGSVHFGSNVIMGVGMGYLAYTYAPEVIPYVLIGCVIGTLITPDMDLEGTTYTERLMRKIPVIGFVWQVAWYPYALLFVHRGWSHSVIFGTLTRVIWLCLIVLFFAIITAGILCLLNQPLPEIVWSTNISAAVIPALLCIYLGWLLEDWNHYLLDWLFSERKRRWRRPMY